jgi:hypothetical protein
MKVGGRVASYHGLEYVQQSLADKAPLSCSAGLEQGGRITSWCALLFVGRLGDK